MKKRKNEIVRLETLINNDRLNVTDEFYKLLSVDLEKLLRDYFDFNEHIGIKIKREGGRYYVNIGLMVNKLFKFNRIPK